jgi:phosphoinositide-3-kinase regulatory subunit 4
MIGVLDMRSMELKSRWQHPLELGPISAVCPTTHWIVVGTVTGSLSLWDLRFGMLLKSWAARGGITSLALHPVRGRGRWVMASLNRDDPEAMSSDIPLVETYDIETAKLVEVFEARNTRPSSRAPLPPSRDVLKTPSDLIAEIAGGRGGTPAGSADSTEAPSVDALLAGTSFAALTPSRVDDALKPGWLVTAGDDRVIRYWDLGRAADGFVMCGSPRDKDVVFKAAAATPSVYYTLPNVRAPGNAGGAAGTASVIGGGAPGAGGGAGAAGHLHAANSSRQPLRPHYDAICALAVVETPFSSCVVSADRSGVIKVWRMEGGAPVRT